jgi:hypothetical protein
MIKKLDDYNIINIILGGIGGALSFTACLSKKSRYGLACGVSVITWAMVTFPQPDNAMVATNDIDSESAQVTLSPDIEQL